jgi:hypothetical protein
MHYLEYSEVRHTLADFRRRLSPNHKFVVYPSWYFEYAGCCHLTPTERIVELVRGDIAPLLAGTKNPEATYSVSPPDPGKLTLVRGDERIASAQDLRIIASSMERIAVSKLVVLEWSKTSRGALYFHDWLEQI